MNRNHRPTGRRTPIAMALLGLFSVPGAFAQQAAPQTPPAPSAQIQPASNAATATPVTGADVPRTLRPVQIRATAEDNDFGANANSVSRLPAELRDIPQSVTIINQAVMQSQGATSLASALRNVPGLTIGGAEGGQIGTNINLNGFTARTDLYLDGARDRAQYYRDTFALDSIEVLMGPSSMLFGRGSTGGVINQVTKKPTLKAADEVQVSASTTGLVRTTLDHNQPLSDTSAFRVAVMGQQGDATTRDQTKLQDFGVAPSLRLGIGTPTEITLTGLLQHNNDMPDYGVPALNGAPVNVNPKTAYGFTDDRTISSIGALGAIIEHRLTPTSSIRNQTQYNNVTTDARETAPHAVGTLTGIGGAFLPFSTGTSAVPAAATSTLPLSQLWVEQQSHDRVIHDTSLFNLTEFNTKFETGTVKHTFLAGVELGHDTYDNQAYSRTGSCNGLALGTGYVGCTPLLNPAQTSSPANAPSIAGNDATASANTVAAYFNDTLELGPHFKLVGGLRQDRYSASIGNSIPSASAAASMSQMVNFTSVRAGGIWQPTGAQSYYLSYSTSFDPSLEQLVSTTGSAQPLPPATNKAYETGGKWDLNGGSLSLSAAAFQITQDNARSQNPDGTYTATGTVRVNGARAGVAGRVTNQLQIFGGYTHLNATITNGIAAGTNGMVPANTPKDSASLWATYAITPQWEAGAGATYSSPRFANNTDLVQVGSYTRWDGMIAYHQPQYDIRLNVYNLLNTNYYDALIPSDGGRSVPGLGRSAMVSVAYRF